MVDRAAEAATEVDGAIGGIAVVADLSEAAAVDALPDDADIVVNDAGLQHVAPVHEFPPDRFTLIQRVMVEAPFRILRRTLPHIYAGAWGRVVNISSVHGLRASAYKSAYVTAKHALEGLSKVVALEGAAHGVTSNCLNPGYVRTPLVERQIADQARAHGQAADRAGGGRRGGAVAVRRRRRLPDRCLDPPGRRLDRALTSVNGSAPFTSSSHRPAGTVENALPGVSAAGTGTRHRPRSLR